MCNYQCKQSVFVSGTQHVMASIVLRVVASLHLVPEIAYVQSLTAGCALDVPLLSAAPDLLCKGCSTG